MLPYNQEGQAFFADFKDNTKNQHNKKLLEEYLSSKNIKRLTELFTEITSFNKILDAERQYLTKLLAFVIIKKIEQEALEQFKEERDPQNKLVIFIIII